MRWLAWALSLIAAAETTYIWTIWRIGRSFQRAKAAEDQPMRIVKLSDLKERLAKEEDTETPTSKGPGADSPQGYL